MGLDTHHLVVLGAKSGPPKPLLYPVFPGPEHTGTVTLPPAHLPGAPGCRPVWAGHGAKWAGWFWAFCSLQFTWEGPSTNKITKDERGTCPVCEAQGSTYLPPAILATQASLS